MFEVSTILEDDSAEIVTGGANRFVKVSLLNTVSSLLCSSSTFVELIGEFVVSLFSEVLVDRSYFSIEVEEDTLAVSDVSRVAREMGVDRALGGLKYSSNIG
ncbi:hypothetical protein Tco_1351382 [Tanacetum coccineum]